MYLLLFKLADIHGHHNVHDVIWFYETVQWQYFQPLGLALPIPTEKDIPKMIRLFFNHGFLYGLSEEIPGYGTCNPGNNRPNIGVTSKKIPDAQAQDEEQQSGGNQ